MPTVRIRTDGLPPGHNALAFMPMPGLTPAGSSHGLIHVYGAPGTMKVAAGPPATRPRLTSNKENVTPSDASPDWFAPQLYLASMENLGPPVGYLPNHSRMPPPVGSAAAQVPPVVQRGRKVGGILSMIWPRVVTRWPNMLGGSSG